MPVLTSTRAVNEFIRILERALRPYRKPAVTRIARRRDPFRVLVSCIISLRTKDGVTDAAAARLFARARTPRALARLPAREIARLIYPASFYRTKARTIRDISRELAARHGGRVPDDLDALLGFRGIGRKTANLVITLGYGKPGICVDTHVHRIANRWGYVSTSTPEATEMALRRRLPRRHWIGINDLLVTFGQHICLPLSPWCSRCPLGERCPRIGVGRRR